MAAWLVMTMVACLAVPTTSNTNAPQSIQPRPQQPTLQHFWDGSAQFVVDLPKTGLPKGESDTLLTPNGELWTYFHASDQSAGVRDRCGDIVEFPGCVVIYQSQDAGRSFQPLTTADGVPICQIGCLTCPCSQKGQNPDEPKRTERDQIDQQQYPRVAYTQDGNWLMVYEYRATIILRRSSDGLTWSPAEETPITGIWSRWLMGCRPEETIGKHPFIIRDAHTANTYDCLIGSPPGIFIEGRTLYVFVGLGQNPGHMGCYVGSVDAPASLLRKCDNNPLFMGAAEYGPTEAVGAAGNPFFDFRTISSADLLHVGDHYYMFFEGVRGPASTETGDTQFALGLARSVGNQIDDRWELYPANPILLDVPGNVGLGHADVVVLDGITYLYTSLDDQTRSRLKLVWQE